MNDLHFNLDFYDQLHLGRSDKYRYDFIKFKYIDRQYYSNINPVLNSAVFIFRTIQNGEGKGNVLIDILKDENINGVQVAYHKNCHFHFIEDRDFEVEGKVTITDYIEITIYENELSKQYVAILKDQLCYPNNDSRQRFKFREMKYLLFTEYDHRKNLNNTSNIEFAPVFQKQLDVIWHENRYRNFNSISYIDEKNIKDGDAWTMVKEKIKSNSEEWHDKYRKVQEELEDEHRSFKYRPVED
ncbi:hypothetical protein [Aneurinibacillus danicus]|uniref:Uncharacterized protein n=1 Tax=Aneurinibacillus danicus TaxID=267746 RepID=A0A511VC62_9BACL|nr:hypothetical protein [Aneurinibacillus danicus]GEN35941.1 hypothetical protein ADA01nite_34010 [Aneurinibacillus danicus]